MMRLPNADVALVRWAGQLIGQPFAWGETNCVALALRALDAQCGSDLMARHHKFMTTERRAMAWVARHGLSGMVERLLSAGCRQIEPAFIQPGDVALHELPGNIGAAVWLGRRWLSADAQGVRQFNAAELAAPSIIVGVR